MSSTRAHSRSCNRGSMHSATIPRIQDETSSALESPSDTTHERPRALKIEVPEAVPQTECCVKFGFPREISHVCAPPFNLQPRFDGAPAGFLDHVRREVDSADLEPSSSQLQRMSAISARHVEHARLRLQSEDALEIVHLGSRLLRDGCLAPYVNGDAVKRSSRTTSRPRDLATQSLGARPTWIVP